MVKGITKKQWEMLEIKTFKAELIVKGEMVDYMEFESDTKEMAFQYAVSRFEKAYPFHTKKAEFKITEKGDLEK